LIPEFPTTLKFGDMIEPPPVEGVGGFPPPPV